MRQRILIMITIGHTPELRNTADSWDWEDGGEASRNLPNEVGLISRGELEYLPRTPLHALGHGWRLLGPPRFIEQYCIYEDNKGKCTHVDGVTREASGWEWWFEKLGA